MKIYTKTGDKGTTSNYAGQRVPKNDPIIEAVGCVDECNCAIGAAIAFIPTDQDRTIKQLLDIQHALFDAGAAISTPRTHATEKKLEKTRFDMEGVSLLENWIDSMELELTPLHTFILPGGHPAGAQLHLARSFVRRAERNVIPLYERGDIDPSVLIYLNRLSDYLFVVSRYINQKLGVPETCWVAHKDHKI